MIIRIVGRALFGALLMASCSSDRITRTTRPIGSLPDGISTDTVLKLHLRDGGVVVMKPPRIDAGGRYFHGPTLRYDIRRRLIGQGRDSVAFDSVALIESNQVHASLANIGMGTMTAVSLAVTGFCMTNPKACFGSCPTFYAWDGERTSLQAEGFSSSIAPVLRATDLDALYRWKRGADRIVEIGMTNEALETHVVDHVDLIAARRPKGGRIAATADGELLEVFDCAEFDRVDASEGDIRALINAYDARERFSLASATDLAERETIELEIDDAPSGPLGLVLGFRESLMTTYLFYQGLAYLGTDAGAWLANAERDSVNARRTLAAMQRVLGGIEVLATDGSGGWRRIAEIDEAGPIATNIQIVPLRDVARPVRLRLRMSKGLWRLNYLALATIGRRVEPRRLRPFDVLRGGVADTAALAALHEPTRSLVTLPGDRFALRYELPDDAEYELFLESRGYYLEWMRTEWLAEQDPVKAARMFLLPAEHLRAEAPRFKAIEPSMEEQFWSSRYVTP